MRGEVPLRVGLHVADEGFPSWIETWDPRTRAVELIGGVTG